jgi:hypothetical protein
MKVNGRTLKDLFFKLSIFLLLTMKFGNTAVFSQNAKIDSLLNLLKTDKADTLKLLHPGNLKK